MRTCAGDVACAFKLVMQGGITQIKMNSRFIPRPVTRLGRFRFLRNTLPYKYDETD